MIVSWNWLKQYVPLAMSQEELETRLMMLGLNHEGTESIGDDLAIDLEVSSNRPDCLGQIGVAREVAVLWELPLTIPDASPAEGSTPVDGLASVRVECPQLCPRYTARVIRGVKVGPSPDWMVRQLATLGEASVNNIVDITNYVLFECGQPLHAFDLPELIGGQIIVREAAKGEKFEAINHKMYELEAGMCVIADAKRAVALGGVMGGANTEVLDETTDLLIESAAFDPISVRTTARRLSLHSPSSHRFERQPDREGIDWASRRCCELIFEHAGGELAAGAIDIGQQPAAREPIVLRLDQIERILGIRIDREEVRKILTLLGNKETTVKEAADEARIEVIPPSWRSDLTREIDLIEEVARIHGYENIPEDVSVPMAPSTRRDIDRVLEKARGALVAAGYDEALTPSAVDAASSEAFSPWSDADPLRCATPILRGADTLRRSLIPSLLTVRHTNQSLANPVIELFEVAHVYLPSPQGPPKEESMLAIAGGGDFYAVKGAIETVLAALNPAAQLEIRPTEHALLRHGAELHLDGQLLGFLGEVSDAGLKQFQLRSAATVAELNVAVLQAAAVLIPQYAQQSSFPAIDRDVNLVVDESVRWADVAATVKASGGNLLESLSFQDTFRDEKKLGPGKKSLLFSTIFRSAEGTLTNQQVDEIREQIVAACEKKLGAELRA
jgi:phenylalanyl-tRNA synthetase beta chain